jgi:MFS family permease
MISRLLFSALTFFIIGKAFLNPFLNRLTADSHIQRYKSIQIEYVRIFAFLKLFANSLTLVFLPQYILHITQQSGFPNITAGILYAFYQVTFVLMLIPGGYLVEIKNLKNLLVIVGILEALTFVLFGIINNFWEVLALQIAFGILVPISSSAEYAYILKFSSLKNRGKTLALYNNTIKGAAIAGLFCGGLLVNYLGSKYTFFSAAGLEGLAAIFALIFIRPIYPKYNLLIKHVAVRKLNFKLILTKLPYLLSNIDILATIFCIALPSGFIEDGIILFASPLLLSKHGINNDIIGQLLVLFSIGFFLASKYIGIKTDKLQKETVFLMIGLLAFAIGLFVLRIDFNIIIYSLGLLILGIARGFIIAPATVHITKNPLIETFSKNFGIAVYRVFETFGRILGPILMMQLLLMSNYTTRVFGWLGMGFVLMAGLFTILYRYFFR